MLNIAIIDMGAVWGGQEIYSKLLANELAVQGWSVSHFSPAENHRNDNIRYERISIGYGDFPALRSRMNSALQGMDIVHFNGIRAIYLSAILPKRQVFVGTKHSPHHTEDKKSWKSAAAIAASLAAFRNLDWLISISNKVREELPAAVRSRSSVVLNGVPDIGRDLARVNDVDRLCLCYVGRLIEQKGLLRLLEAMDLLRGRQVSVQLLIAGTGPLEERARQFVNERNLGDCVEFLGYCDRPEVVYARAHLCVLPSQHEGLPLSLLEAQSAGCGLIGHDIPGVREVICSQMNGLLTPATPQGLADAIQQLECDRIQLGRLRSAARRDYEHRWQLSRMVHDTVAVYEQATGKGLAR